MLSGRRRWRRWRGVGLFRLVSSVFVAASRFVVVVCGGAHSRPTGTQAPRRTGWTNLLPPAAYLVVADEAYGRAIPSAFLDKMAAEFTAKYADKAAQAKEFSLSPSYG